MVGHIEVVMQVVEERAVGPLPYFAGFAVRTQDHDGTAIGGQTAQGLQGDDMLDLLDRVPVHIGGRIGSKRRIHHNRGVRAAGLAGRGVIGRDGGHP